MNPRNTMKLFLKLILCTLVFAGAIALGVQVFSPNSLADTQILVDTDTPNNQNYQSAYAANFGSVGVALSTRIGIDFKNTGGKQSTNTFYKEIASVGKNSEENRKIRSELISQNMLYIQEYLNLSRTDIKSLLATSTNRKSTLEGYISQIELRYKNALVSLQSLQKQKTLLLAELERVSLSIENTKKSMEKNFSGGEANNTLGSVDQYFALRASYTESFTDIVFINQFIKQYTFLNDYNKGFLDTLINNKQAIINESYIVIPDSGSQYLRPLELIFDEAEIKEKNTSN